MVSSVRKRAAVLLQLAWVALSQEDNRKASFCEASQILQEKTRDICNKIPSFRREIDWRRGKTQEGKDSCRYIFKNGSAYGNVAARESSRGLRKHGGLIEECVGVDQRILQEVLIPMMNVSRRCADGTVQEDEVLNQSQLYITTAGYKNTYSYEKLIQTLVQMITEPGKAFIMGGTYRIPILMGLQPKTFINDLRRDSTFNEASFEREYGSHWTGMVDGAFFDGDKFDRNRTIALPEKEHHAKNSKINHYYVLAVDVGRKACQTAICVLKVTPQPLGESVKKLVNIITLEESHFEDQAIRLKKLFYLYKAKRMVIDGNGLGIGLLDYMVKPQVLPDGDVLPDFGIYNDKDGSYKKYRTNHTEDNAIYVMKANAPINTEAHSITQIQLESGKLKFLVDERIAKNKLLGTKVGQNMSYEQMDEYLRPYTLTSILKEEMMNLREENEGINIILKPASSVIGKDKFSALEYGLYYIKNEEENRHRRKRSRFSEMMFMS